MRSMFFRIQIFLKQLPKSFEGLFTLNILVHNRSMKYSNDIHPPPVKYSSASY